MLSKGRKTYAFTSPVGLGGGGFVGLGGLFTVAAVTLDLVTYSDGRPSSPTVRTTGTITGGCRKAFGVCIVGGGIKRSTVAIRVGSRGSKGMDLRVPRAKDKDVIVSTFSLASILIARGKRGCALSGTSASLITKGAGLGVRSFANAIDNDGTRFGVSIAPNSVPVTVAYRFAAAR